ncbi:uncharacterized protein LOC144627109 isoform X2 [Crassostrea virginica]
MPQVNLLRSIDIFNDFQFSSLTEYTCFRVRMANAQLRSPGPGQATPAHHESNEEQESSPAEAEESDNNKVDESEDSHIEHISVADKTEDDYRRQWSSEQIRKEKRG